MSSKLWLGSLEESLSSPQSVSELLIHHCWFEGAELLMDPSHLEPALRSVLSTYTRWLMLGLSAWGGSNPTLLSGCSGCCYFQSCCLSFTSGVTCFHKSCFDLFTSRVTRNHKENKDLMTTETNLWWNPVILVRFSKFLAQLVFKASLGSMTWWTIIVLASSMQCSRCFDATLIDLSWMVEFKRHKNILPQRGSRTQSPTMLF